MEESSIIDESESGNPLNNHVNFSVDMTCDSVNNTNFKLAELSVTLTEEEQGLIHDGIPPATKTADMMECTTASISVDESHGDEEATIAVASEFLNHRMIEIGRRLWTSTPEKQQYTKGCIWSPDGTCILVPVQFDGMHVIELPRDLYDCSDVSEERPVSALPTEIHVKEGGTVYDFSWYPLMNSESPPTCCWLASRQHEPIHMWDAFNGELRCSYRGYDDVDEVESAISLAFSCDGDKVIGGFKKSIKIFDTNIPGRDCCSIPTKKAISCFAINSESNMSVTAGTWNGYIHHYDLRSPKLGSLFTLGGHTGGITWLRYIEAASGLLLISGARKDNKLFVWDMRNYSKPLREYERVVETNQRIYFDVDPYQQWLVSGSTDGKLRAWELDSDESPKGQEIPVHSDCCNGVSFHPSRPIVASSAGQFHFVKDASEEDTPTITMDGTAQERIVNYENSLVLLWYSKSRGEQQLND